MDDGPGKIKAPYNPFYMVMIILMITFLFNPMDRDKTAEPIRITYSQFLDLVESGSVAEVQMNDTQIQIAVKEDTNTAAVDRILYPNGRGESQESAGQRRTYYADRVDDPGLVELLRGHRVGFSGLPAPTVSILSSLFSMIFPFLIMILIYYIVFRVIRKRMGGGSDSEGTSGGMLGGMMGGVGKSKARVYNVEKSTGISFDDVAGQDEAKESLAEMIDFLQNPQKYQKIGAKQPKGALLVGPPGTGKTLLARAVAGEAGVVFYHLTGSEFVEMFVGVGASRVRDLFQTAKKSAPCIIFIDEIDAIGSRRGNQMGGNDEREQTLNQLLSEMDGFDSFTGIVVLAATNRPEMLDKALLRPGRFDRRIIVEKPDLPGREAILQLHANKVKLEADVNLREIAQSTSGATGADLANMVNEAALRAVKMGRETVLQEDLMEAVEVVIAGKEKKDRILSPREKRMVAFHEVGHALVSALQKNAQPVQKITIVPRTMGTLGYTMNAPEEERYLMTRDELLSQITALLGGRAAEMVVFDTSSTGAANDIERATKLARNMVTQYGMSGKFGSMGLESTTNQYLDGRNMPTCSEQTNAAVDEEILKILEECQQAAVSLLEGNLDSLTRISEYLLEKENITGEQFMKQLAKNEEEIPDYCERKLP